MTFYHFTCRCCDKRILSGGGWIKPLAKWEVTDEGLALEGFGPSGLLRAPSVVWVTDMEVPDREALGLTMRKLRCDRTEVRYRVHGEIEPWLTWAIKHGATATFLDVLPGDPERWFVSESPLFILSRARAPYTSARAPGKEHRPHEVG